MAKGVNLAAAALADGPIADQVKEVVKAVKDKTTYFHDQIFRGIMDGRRPRSNPAEEARRRTPAKPNRRRSPTKTRAAMKAWEPKAKEWNENKPKLLAERMAKTAEFDAAIHAASSRGRTLSRSSHRRGAADEVIHRRCRFTGMRIGMRARSNRQPVRASLRSG